MFITKRARYALRSFVDFGIVFSQTKKPVNLSIIARNQDLSRQFLANIFHQFVRSGLLKSLKGRNGGFILARPLKKISVLDIIKTVSVPFSTIDCLIPERGCTRLDRCPMAPFWKTFSSQTHSYLSRISIWSLANNPAKYKKNIFFPKRSGRK